MTNLEANPQSTPEPAVVPVPLSEHITCSNCRKLKEPDEFYSKKKKRMLKTCDKCRAHGIAIGAVRRQKAMCVHNRYKYSCKTCKADKVGWFAKKEKEGLTASSAIPADNENIVDKCVNHQSYPDLPNAPTRGTSQT